MIVYAYMAFFTQSLKFKTAYKLLENQKKDVHQQPNYTFLDKWGEV